jgi:hypothetical protein
MMGLAAVLAASSGMAAEIMPIDVVPETPIVVPAEGFSATFPRGWGLLRRAPNAVRATRAGATVSLLSFEFHPQWRTATGRPVASLSAIDLAEVVMASESKEADPLDARLESLTPASPGGCRGFRAEVVRNVGTVRYRRVTYGWTVSGGYYTLTYDAPAVHYFAQDLAAFEASVASVAVGRKRAWNKCAIATS